MTSRDLTFTVTFHAPFLIASGSTGDGLDAVGRTDSLLPASTLKGAMRAAAENVLGVAPAALNEVFGRRAEQNIAPTSSAWAWSDGSPNDAFLVWDRSRVRLDSDTFTAKPEALSFIAEYWQRPNTQVTFRVEPTRYFTADDLTRHQAVLQASAYAVTSLGHWRNRGMGTVTIRPKSPLAADQLVQVCAP